jgi:hypothetical protein
LRVTNKLIVSPDLKDTSWGVPDNKIDFTKSTIPTRNPKKFCEFSLEFYLNDEGLRIPGRLQELAVALVPALALKEDFYLFQMSEKSNPLRDVNHPHHPSPPNVKISNWQIEEGYSDYGLLSEASPHDTSDSDWVKVSKPIHVPLLESNATIWGQETARAVLEGIAKLMCKRGKGNKGFALFLPIEVWADAMLPGYDDTPSATSIINQSQMGVDIEVVPCRVLPKDEGLLINLVGDPVKIYYGLQPEVQVEDFRGGNHYFRIVERLQYVVSDPRALVLLKFEQPVCEQEQND